MKKVLLLSAVFSSLTLRIGFTGRVDYTLPYNLRVGFSFWIRRSTKLGSMTMISPHL
jgi:hypothetical protein